MKQIVAPILIAILLANVLVIISQSQTLADLGIIMPFAYRAAEAQNGQVLLERGRDYEKWQLEDNSLKLVIGVDPWTWDGSEWVPHIVQSFGNNTVFVQSGMISWKIYPQEAEAWDANFTEFRAKELWLPQIDSATLGKFFDTQTVIENSTGVFVTNSYSASYNSFWATLDIIYAIHDGEPTERIVQFNSNLPDNIASKIKIDREWIEINADTFLTDTEVDTVITNTKSTEQDGSKNVARFMKDGKLVLHENLLTAGDKLKTISYNSSKATFSYSGWTKSDFTLKDDTYASSTPTEDTRILTNSATGASCPTASYSKSDATYVGIEAQRSDVSTFCMRGSFEWDISSITDGSDVTNVVFKYDVTTASSPRNCDYMPMASQPSAAAAADIWTDIGDGTAFLGNDATCTTVGDNKSVDLGTSADTDVENKLAGDWFAVGIKLVDESRTSGIDHIVRISDSSAASTPDPTLEITYTPLVTLQIRLTAASGSDTMETAGVSATISGTDCTGTLTHDGNNALQTFTCGPSATITVTYPSDTATSRFRDAAGAQSFQFTSCAAGTCAEEAKTMYRQLKLTITPSGLDASRQLSITRTQLGSSGTDNINGATATGVWGDQRTNIVPSDSVTVTASQERFQSYNSTAERTVNMTAAASKTYVFQHEFNTQFRVHEDHHGFIFAPMPDAEFTGTITTANGTVIAADYLSDDSQDDHSVLTTGRVWVENGTQTMTNITWRGLVVNSSGTCSVTSYGNCDIEANSEHLGVVGNIHFRIATDEGTLTDPEFSSLGGLTWTSTATGTRDTKVEFLKSIFDGVTEIKLDGAVLADSSYSVSIDPSEDVGVLTINDISFSDHTFQVTFSGTGGEGGGGGGGGGGGDGGQQLVTPGITGQFSIDVRVPPAIAATPGQPVDIVIEVFYSGTTHMNVYQVTFTNHPEWFALQTALPLRSTTPVDGKTFKVDVPVRVTVPANVQGVEADSAVTVSAASGLLLHSQTKPFIVVYAPSEGIGLYAVIAVALGGVGLTLARTLQSRRG